MYYGKLFPFELYKKALRNTNTMGYLNSTQVLKILNAYNSPILVYGDSYGGMLATLFRLKYLYIALSTLASLAPVLYFNRKK
ncbi:hypothetical protein AHAS_Ahas04G0077400 [Arachis hypogaea]